MKPTWKILNFAGIMSSTTFFFVVFLIVWFKKEVTFIEPNKAILGIEVLTSFVFLIICNKKAWEALRGVK